MPSGRPSRPATCPHPRLLATSSFVTTRPVLPRWNSRANARRSRRSASLPTRAQRPRRTASLQASHGSPRRPATHSPEPAGIVAARAAREAAALVALLGLNRHPWQRHAELVERAGSAVSALEDELAGVAGQASLLAVDPEPLIAAAAERVARWRGQGFRLVSVLDDDYPENLRAVHDRPPLVFVAGRLRPDDRRAIAVIGSRRAGPDGLRSARELAEDLVAGGVTVVSGLAAGIDTAAHVAALEAGGRTVAVIGTGLAHSYPPQNAGLQRQIAERGAVISQFWPEAAPSRASFPRRNAVMSGLALGTVVVEASHRSGARVQARLALAHGRPVFLLDGLLAQAWARELAARPGVHVVRAAAQISEALERLIAGGALVE